MDVFRFRNPTHSTLLEQGELINGLKSKMWIERFRDFCDFEFVANAEKRTHLLLPVGTLLSHVDSTEVMIVENHEITETEGQPTEVKITGRSFESFYENRIVGSNKLWPTEASATEDYVLSADTTWNQAITLIKDHTDIAYVLDLDDAISYMEVMTSIDDTGDMVERILKRGDLYTRLIELLAVDNLGIRVMRPGVRSPLGFASQNMAVVIHKGLDLSGEIAFSHTTGEIESADYLWSNKRLRNSALISGRWLETVVKTSDGYSRRMMFIDASDLDSAFSEPPFGTDRDNILEAMRIRGEAALSAQNELAIVKAEPTRQSMQYKYREHYDVGDIITVAGEYSATASMRISEYVEIEDENGEIGYPTFSAI